MTLTTSLLLFSDVFNFSFPSLKINSDKIIILSSNYVLIALFFNDYDSEILNTMSSKMLELSFMILEMIFESFGIEEKQYEALVRDSVSLLRVMKYKVPTSEDQNLGLVAHTDKNAITILCQNEVQGLEIVTKEGHWEQVVVPKDALVVMVGDALKVSIYKKNNNHSFIHHLHFFTMEIHDSYQFN